MSKWTGRDPKGQADPTLLLLINIHISCRSSVGFLGPENFIKVSLAQAWERRTFAKHERLGSGRHPGPRYHCFSPSQQHPMKAAGPPSLGALCPPPCPQTFSHFPAE